MEVGLEGYSKLIKVARFSACVLSENRGFGAEFFFLGASDSSSSLQTGAAICQGTTG